MSDWTGTTSFSLPCFVCHEEKSREKQYLNFRKDRNNGNSNAQDHVKAYEELVLSAGIRLRVENVEENNKNQGQGIEQACTGQQSWRKKNFFTLHIQF